MPKYTRRQTAGGLGIVGVLLGIVIGLSLVSTVATSTTSASTALAPFTGAQALVIIVPLIFVAIILISAYRHTHPGGSMAVSLEMRLARTSKRLIVIIAYHANRLVIVVARLAATQINRN